MSAGQVEVETVPFYRRFSRADIDSDWPKHEIHTQDWRERKIKKAATAEPGLMKDVLSRLIPLIGAGG